MSIFSSFYGRQGPGISKDTPKKKGAALYFQLFSRHILDFIKENLMYVISSIPMFLAMYFSISYFDIFSLQSNVANTEYAASYEMIKTVIVIISVILLGSGPASASMAYMMRCVTREEHCFLWSDFIEKYKENFRQGMIVAAADVLIASLIIPIALKFYYTRFTETSEPVWLVMVGFIIVISVIYVLMHGYFYQFIITFDLKLNEAIKNSFIMALGYLPLNLLIAIIPVVLTIVLAMFFKTLFVIIFSLIFWVAFMRYPIEFLSARIIYRKMNSDKQE